MSVQTRRAGWKVLLPSLAVAAVAAQHGCKLSAYEDARARAAGASVLVSPETLDGWLARGYGTDAFGYDKLVVLDVSTGAAYAAGHVPGAFHLDVASDLSTSRSGGIGGTYGYTDTSAAVHGEINAPAEVATGEMMNALFRRTGIDRNTVVALAGDSLLNVGLAYFNFRYWGFPKERLRVLDRTKAAAGLALSTAVPPAPAPSTYKVCDLAQNTSLRASLSDMIDVAKGAVPQGIAWDVRNQNEYDGLAGATTGPFMGKPGYSKKVAFEGRVKGAVHLPYTALLDGSTTFLGSATIAAALADKGITREVLTHIY